MQVMIDFGLSYNTNLAEDKAVDLYVLERAFSSAHAACGNLVCLCVHAEHAVALPMPPRCRPAMPQLYRWVH
jgi:tRNA A-37 threonylcarbamoyl transferase component Bud32